MTAAAGSARFVKPPTPPARAADATAGCCLTCPIAAGCALFSDAYVTCPVTGNTAPPAPLGFVPTQAAQAAPHGGTDWTNVAGRGVEAAASVAFGFGWLDIATGLIERFNATDAEGNPVDWGRLQLKRNGLCILIATLVPLGDHTAAQWVAHTLPDLNLADPVFLPAGAVLGAVLPVFAGQFAPGAVGGICRAAWGAGSFTARTAWRFLTSRMGWIVVRPAVWGLICGGLILTWRFLVHFLTGA
ncbi:hypothetical protein [Streptomyces sp. NPDC097619]|uniref:hypothetical protein n=1 Tax=Streptomyces sp. NPDC097619 TaxID=3157228 RepID=UPI003322B7BA